MINFGGKLTAKLTLLGAKLPLNCLLIASPLPLEIVSFLPLTYPQTLILVRVFFVPAAIFTPRHQNGSIGPLGRVGFLRACQKTGLHGNAGSPCLPPAQSSMAIHCRVLTHTGHGQAVATFPGWPGLPTSKAGSLVLPGQAWRGHFLLWAVHPRGGSVGEPALVPGSRREMGCTPRGSCNNTLLRRVLKRLSNSKCFLEGFVEGVCKGFQ